VVFILLLFTCALALLAARRYGIRTPDVTLWPIGGMANLERIPEKPGEELVVTLAEPAVNIVIAAVLIFVLGVGLDGGSIADLENARAGILSRVASANIFLLIFNLIPAFPMDGGRVLRALLAMRVSHVEATRSLVGLFVNPMLIVIERFIYLSASRSAARCLPGTPKAYHSASEMSSIEA
jgi:stage IV sporulation protein FB